MKYGVEREGHGFYGAVDMDGNPVLTANTYWNPDVPGHSLQMSN
jgi:mannose/cellobiose epimerase-like protein (N-acyl-D-glucosamine 2-epimerase family)